MDSNSWFWLRRQSSKIFWHVTRCSFWTEERSLGTDLALTFFMWRCSWMFRMVVVLGISSLTEISLSVSVMQHIKQCSDMSGYGRATEMLRRDVPREGGGGVWGRLKYLPPPPNFQRPSKIVPNSTRLWKLLKIAEFLTPTPQDFRKKSSKILKLPSVRNYFTLAMTNKFCCHHK